jgi:transposase
MGITRRQFTVEFKAEASPRLIDTGRAMVEVAAELSVMDILLNRWVRDEDHRMETMAGGSEGPLTAAQQTKLVLLRRQVAEQDKDVAFPGEAAAHFASNPPKQRDSR